MLGPCHVSLHLPYQICLAFKEIVAPKARFSVREIDAPGPGIGLGSRRRMLERIGGRVSFESETSIGSTFSFTLPMKPASI